MSTVTLAAKDASIPLHLLERLHNLITINDAELQVHLLSMRGAAVEVGATADPQHGRQALAVRAEEEGQAQRLLHRDDGVHELADRELHGLPGGDVVREDLPRSSAFL